MEHDEENGIPAEKAGAFIAEKALQKKLPVMCTIGGKYKVFVFLTRLIPTKLMADLVGKIYASKTDCVGQGEEGSDPFGVHNKTGNRSFGDRAYL